MVLDLSPEQIGQAAAWLIGVGGLAGAQRQAMRSLRADLARIERHSAAELARRDRELERLQDQVLRLVERQGFAGSGSGDRPFWAPV